MPCHSDRPSDSTSPERLHELIEQLGAIMNALPDQGSHATITRADASALFIAAVRMYAGQSYGGTRGPSGAELEVTPTEAVTAAAALLRSQQLTPFEFAIWYSEHGATGGIEEES